MRETRWRRRGAPLFGVLVLAACAGAVLVGAGPAGAAPGTCTPGSGRQLAGKQISAANVGPQDEKLRCADLTGANLSGLDLTQADLTGILAPNANFSGAKLGQATLSGAVLRGANLQNADLVQATLTGADLSGATLDHAHLGQIEAAGVNLANADLTDADLTQATLDQADLAGANVDGADFTQASLTGADVKGLRGLTDWSSYLLIGAGVIFLLLLFGPMRRALRRGPKDPQSGPIALTPVASAPVMTAPAAGSIWQQAQAQSASIFQQRSPAEPGLLPGTVMSPAALAGFGSFHPINGPRTRGRARGIVLGLLGAVCVAFGLHMFVGGILGQVASPFDSLTTTACSGAQCAVGINSGMVGIYVGIIVAIAGFAIRIAA